ncbi:helix-turn-helix domain-containing protein [Deinococcus pimensis]|uniref:helix-turn-helix domain-containing protein n=1 Tax=Deinococcus pimensis TaxID=309888 RepID=UPI0004ADEA65|nr:cupin domain-containing protein [Deinococcus pimensis]
MSSPGPSASVMTLGRRIRGRRRHLGLTLAVTSERSGLSVPYLSQVERDQANPTVTALGAIAHALGVNLNYFLPAGAHAATVRRATDTDEVRLHELGYRVDRLAPGGPDAQLEPLLVRIPPGYAGAPSTHLGEEFLYVVSGRLRVTVSGDTSDLGPGDSVHHASTVPHAWANPWAEDTVLVWVGTPRLFT